MNDSVLRAEQVTYGFGPGSMFLGPIDLEVPAGTFCAVVGPNGAGKSTLLRVLVGLAAARQGTIEVAGRRLRALGLTERAKLAAFLPQNPQSPPSATAAEIVLLGRYPYRALRLFDTTTDLDVARQAMTSTETLPFADRLMETLSGGEAQRVHLAAALAQEPRLLVLDEPTSDLDLYHQLSIFGLIRRLTREEGLTALVVTHDLNLAAQYCDQVILLNHGRVVSSGSPEKVLDHERLEEVYGVRFAEPQTERPQRPWLMAVEVEGQRGRGTEGQREKGLRTAGSHRRLTARRYGLWLAACVGVLLVVLAVSPGVGTQPVGVADAWRALLADQPDAVQYGIAWQLRFPRALKALVAGATLALVGAVFQTQFRNPLATPYTLGIASGGSLGALIAYEAGWITSILGVSTVSVAAFAGSLGVVVVLLGLARSSARITGNTLLLAGVTIGFFCSGMMMFVTSLADVQETYHIVHWMMGSLHTVTLTDLKALLPIVIPAWVILVSRARALTQFEVGSEIAAARGVNVARLQVLSIVVGSLAVAGVVSMCGPIGFVGLIIPHVTVLVVGRDHRILLPAAALLGAAFLIGCDFLTTLVPGWYGLVAGRETRAVQLPIGVMTAIVGTPVFLAMLCSRLKGVKKG